MPAHRHFDAGSTAVILITLLLFVAALATKWLTHDMLLEAGVFLVSVKLIILGYKNGVSSAAVERQLEDIKTLLQPSPTIKEQSCAPASSSPLSSS